MKYILLTGILLFISTGTSIAQKNNTSLGKHLDQQLKVVQEKLQIDNLQLLMIKDILVSSQQKRASLQKLEIPDEEKRIQMREILLNQEKKLSTFLNDKQITEFKKIMRKQQKEIKKSRPQRKNNRTRRNARSLF